MSDQEYNLLVELAQLVRNHFGNVEGLRGRLTISEAAGRIEKLLTALYPSPVENNGPKW